MKVLQKVSILVLFIAVSGFTLLHKYYVSVTDIDYKNNSLQMISRLFIDDTEKMLLDRYDEKLSFDNKNDESKINYYLQKYFSDKLKVEVDGEVQKLIFLGWELEDDQVHCYLEVENLKSIKKLKITNKLLFDIFENQQNITHVNVKERTKSFLFVTDNSSGVLNF